VSPDAPVRPPNLYGASKVWGEALARFYADTRGLSCICLRLGWVKSADDSEIRSNKLWLKHVLTHGDLAKLIVAGIEAPAVLRFGIFHGISNNRRKQFDISDARQRLGYTPEDDAFKIAKMPAGRGRRSRWQHVMSRLKEHI
jgi:nucleoside-diphosphate-sugar epimerase